MFPSSTLAIYASKMASPSLPLLVRKGRTSNRFLSFAAGATAALLFLPGVVHFHRLHILQLVMGINFLGKIL